MAPERVHPALRHRVLVLVGLMGSGKSTVGPLIADRVGLPFADLDALIEASTGHAIRDLIVTEGENAFRAIESEVLADALSGPPVVLATGGGAVGDPRSRQLLTDGPVVVWLQAPVATLVERVGGVGAAGRPLLDEGPVEVLTRLETERAPLYAEVAAISIETGHDTPDGVAASVVDALDQMVDDGADLMAGAEDGERP